MNNADKEYLRLCEDILKNGTPKEDRTSTGTLSVFGRQLRFDLSEGFPLLTTKRVPFRLIAEELLFFIGGKTNLKDLLDKDVDIWTRDGYAKFKRDKGVDTPMTDDGLRQFRALAKLDGYDLGPIYGAMWRTWGARRTTQPTPKLREGLKATYLGVGNGAGKEHHPLGKTWEGMMARCYDKGSVSYRLYGAKGVYVADEWLEFTKFAEDAVSIPGYVEKMTSETRYVLDKDINGTGTHYSKENCSWVTDAENGAAKSKRTYVLERNGIEYKFRNPTAFAKEQGISDKNLSDLWTGAKNAKVRYGFRLVEVIEDEPEFIDQLALAIEEIKTNPDSRRMIVSAWNPAELDEMALPPCHIMFQFYVADGKLSLQMYQRSADVFLGLPFNIASYALLLEMVALECELDCGELIITIGDCHVYTNHIEQVKTQLTREPKELPWVNIIQPRGGGIDSYDIDCFYLSGYEPHRRLRGEQSF